jgi:MoaA/NifB/PqqE/SkfB family radical SAM enzyme
MTNIATVADRSLAAAPLVDGFGRVHTDLRISVTDRCNIRCFYCMPAENVRFKPRAEILTFEEIERFVRVVAEMGINKLRLTGGEPLVRHDLDRLVARLAAIEGIKDIALTTNGILLAKGSTACWPASLPPSKRASGRSSLMRSLSAGSPRTRLCRSPSSRAVTAWSCGSSNTCRSMPTGAGIMTRC